jgi:crotonobetainyl-CoA:carnitine CoA-transferase CaiB-like acyl-CoA transferase
MMPPLAGIRVLDLSQNLPGPYATLTLASLGAEVVKIEPPKGDPARTIEPLFSMLNQGKKSVVLDLREEAGKRALRALVESADVVVEGFRPGVMARLGCSPETALSWNPRLVWCSISAWGRAGPSSSAPGHDLNAQAMAGLCWLERGAGDIPHATVLPTADLSTALVAVAGISSALVGRAATGKGAILDLGMADAPASWAQIWGEGVDLAGPARRALPGGGRLAGAFLGRLSRRKLYNLPAYGLFRCADRRWLAIGIVDEGHFWRNLCKELGFPRQVGSLGMASRTALGSLLRPLVAARLRTADRATWLARLKAADIPVNAVNTLDDARREPQLAERGLFDEAGLARPPVPGGTHVPGPVPSLGQHTAELLDQGKEASNAR